jgi:hypothetical protein
MIVRSKKEKNRKKELLQDSLSAIDLECADVDKDTTQLTNVRVFLRFEHQSFVLFLEALALLGIATAKPGLVMRCCVASL